MKASIYQRQKGFTLIEVLIALLILSILSLLSYRGLSTILDTRTRVTGETEKWRHLSSFLVRFEQDIQLVMPYSPGTTQGNARAWRGRPGMTPDAQLEFSRFASSEGVDAARRVAYRLNEKNEIELWLWPGLNVSSDVAATRYPVLRGVNKFELHYMNANQVWVDHWPTTPDDANIPLAVQLQITLTSGEEIKRVFSLRS